MNKTIKRLWVKALRSGEYRQGKGTLAATVISRGELPEVPTEFCCLGVMCDVAFDDWWYEDRVDTIVDYGTSYNAPQTVQHKRFWQFGRGKSPRHQNSSLLSPAVLKKVGLTRQQQEVLASMNDRGRPFDQIADWIEINL